MSIIQKINENLKKNKINFFTGVPDSILKNYLSSFKNLKKKNHIISSNEGGAISLATGYYLAKKKMALVYLQNSGLGNIINPITSMSHKSVYGIPMILFIGWRGAPGIKDEIQHNFQGKITLNQLKILNIKYKIFNKYNYNKQLDNLIRYSKKNLQPVAYLFRSNDFDIICKKKIIKKKIKNNKDLLRSKFITTLIENSKNSRIVATTGFTSRELFQLRNKIKNKSSKDFYMVGAMGHSIMVALGYSLNTKNTTICLDGDGSFLMHMGSSVIAASYSNKNFKYILLNNGCHESVGGQKTSINNINLKLFSKSLGYKSYFEIKNNNKIEDKLKNFLKTQGPSFLNVEIRPGVLNNLLRIKNLTDIKRKF